MNQHTFNIIFTIFFILWIPGIFLFLGWSENRWTELNEWYDINGRGDVRLNVDRMFRSQKWKDTLESMKPISDAIEKHGSVTILD